MNRHYSIIHKGKIQQDAKMYQNFTVPDNVHQLHVQQPSTYENPETASVVLGS
jgi:hypothetical protein